MAVADEAAAAKAAAVTTANLADEQQKLEKRILPKIVDDLQRLTDRVGTLEGALRRKDTENKTLLTEMDRMRKEDHALREGERHEERAAQNNIAAAASELSLDDLVGGDGKTEY